MNMLIPFGRANAHIYITWNCYKLVENKRSLLRNLELLEIG